MQQFTVPQFIDVEDKIIGPITTRQFLILISGAILIAIFWKIFDFTAFVFFSSMVVIFFATFAFVKINGVAFHYFLLNFMQTLKRPALRVWDKSFDKNNMNDEIEIVAEKEEIYLKGQFSSSRLNELSLIVDTHGEYKGEKNSGAEVKTLK